MQATPGSRSVDAVRRSGRPVESSPGVGSRGGKSTFPPPGSISVREISVEPVTNRRDRRYPASSTSTPALVMASSAPAHFMQPVYSDPPGTAVTSNGVGRPSRSWAGMLVACGVFVALAGTAVLRMGTSAIDATAGFVDPSRSTKVTLAAAAAAPPPEAPVSVPAVATPAVAAPQAAVPTTTAAPLAAVPVVVTPAPTPAAFAPVNVAPAAAPAPAAAAPAPKAVATLRPATTWKPPPPAPKPVAKAPTLAADEEPAAPVAKKSPAAKKAGKSEADDETKKALEALQKAQLESASSFGDK